MNIREAILGVALGTAASLNAASETATGVNEFGCKLWQELARENSNIIISPFNISTALAMVKWGARADTEAEISAVLGPAPDAGSIERLTNLANTHGDQLLHASGLWIENAVAVRPGFLHAMQISFRARPIQVDFRNDPEGSRVAMNLWFAQHTGGKIRDLWKSGDITPKTRLVLASATYFRGKWRSPFRTGATHPVRFVRNDGTSVIASFMNQTGQFAYGETDDAQLIEMPYVDGALVFDVILPKTPDRFSSMARSLTDDRLSSWLARLAPTEISVSTPKFRIESQFSLENKLTAMGMRLAFTEMADFSGIDGRRDLMLNKIVHHAFVEVSEEGTEAAAATGISAAPTAVRKIPVFRADHPFLFIIRDVKRGVLLFMGQVTDPSI